MAVSFWLPKVIVILTVCGVSCAFDDLLDRVRLSASNDPEVRDFLNTVLKHRNDFNWIHQFVTKGQPEHILPLHGLPLKSKRSFHSHRGAYPNFRTYGYKPHRYIGYLKPTNDAYPYEDENDSKFAENGRFKKRNARIYPQYDFIDEHDGSNKNRRKREIGEYEDEEEVPGGRLNKREQDVEKLLNEKMILHSLLHNSDRPKFRKVFKDTYEKNLPSNLGEHDWDQVQIFPNSEKGVLYAPGNKYECRGDGRKRCVDSNNLDDHEYITQMLHKKDNFTLEAPLGEFYYSNPHDVLGITKDQQMEMHDNGGGDQNITCVSKIKRSIHFDDFLSHPGKRARTDDKSIKIKIFDDGRLVKDIKKGEANSIVLTIKNEKGSNIFQSSEKPQFHDPGRIMDDLSIYSNMIPVYQSIRDDNTLQKIDSIIQRDQASLKLNSQIPYGVKQKKDAYVLHDENINQLIRDLSKDGINKKAFKERSVKSSKLHPDFDSSESSRKSFPLDQLSGQNRHRMRADDIGSRVENRNSHGDPEGRYDYRPKGGKKLFLSNTANMVDVQSVESEPIGEHQNRLDEQSEPTSAAEQRELGRINNSFNTPSMDVLTTEKMMIIPFKKNSMSIVDDDIDDEPDTRFRVKAARDMIHSKHKKSPETEASHGVLLSKNLKDADEVLDKLKSDLEKTIKVDYAKERLKSLGGASNYAGFDDVYNSVNHAEYDENEIKTIQDDNMEMGKELMPVVKAKRTKIGRSKVHDRSSFEEAADVIEDVADADDVDENNFQNKKLTRDNFRIRKLLSIDDEQEANDDCIDAADSEDNGRYKRSITDFLGMSNDEDYSEDKVDYYDNELKKRSENNEENNFRIPKMGFLRSTKNAAKKKASEKKDKRQHAPVKTKRNLFTNKLDYIGKRDSEGIEPPPEEPNNNVNEPDKEAQSAGGNELDIIEKTQAILLHITNPPLEGMQVAKDTPPMRGEFDDNDDPNSKLDESREVVNNNNNLNAKHANVIKLQNFDKNEDIIGAIMKLVNNYKDSEKRKHVQEKKSKNNEAKVNEEVESYDDGEDASFAHHLHKDKKAHPSSMYDNNCKIKPGTDHFHPKHVDQEMHFDVPKAVKEGFADVEMMSDKDRRSDKDDNEMKRDLENPMKFTPDRLDSFNDIIESPRYRRNLRNYMSDEQLKYLGKSDEEFFRNMQKRHAKGGEDSFKNLEDMNYLHRNSKYMFNPYYYPNLQRFRQQAAAPPQAKTDGADAGGSTTVISTTIAVSESSSSGNPGPNVVTGAAQATAANLITTSTYRPKIDPKQLKSCGTTEATTINPNMTTCMTSKKPQHPHGLNCHHHHHLSPETLRERKLKELNRERMREDILREKMKEHEHLKDLLNGHIMLDIMDKFQEKLKKNEKLNSRFGHAFGKKCATQQVELLNKFREEQSKKDIKHAQLMLHQVIVMMNKIVADQVHRRSCVVLPPEVKEFLTKLGNVLKGTTKSMQVAEGYPLPQVGGQNGNSPLRPDDKQPDFLFDNPKEDTETVQTDPEVAMRRKIGILRRLLSKYDHMSEKCQVKVQPVKEYLQSHLDMLEKMLMENKYESDFNEMVCTISPIYAKKCKNMTTPADSTTAAATTVAGSASVNVTTAAASTTASTAATPHAGRSALKGDQYDDDFASPFFDRNFGKFESSHGKKLSEKYRKLVEAADNYRRKREIEQRLAHLFGRKRRESFEGKKKEEADDLSNVAFEAPLVYSLDG